MHELESDQLLVTCEELQHRVSSIKTLSLPQVLKDDQLKKRQMKLRQNMYHQIGKIFMTHEGKAKSVDDLLKELSDIISSNPVHVRRNSASNSYQQLLEIFKRPSLLIGIKFKHRFEIDSNLEWFEGHVLKYSKGNFTLHYDIQRKMCVFC